ncbi:methylmalonyl Co-A mutase-associated GTPase MeaB [Marivibrio halodurans]|uniref:Methylmalonyl Co-A mutase-associated GTPase MeaB n=1 Tax=Marivibrio halodurans TaxID=2039722 RepID=A0A8J7S3K8_9PROT|nr:methylmalonyl Co-A mutase-associated GTPase MeaB [Marivibrio halodurans]
MPRPLPTADALADRLLAGDRRTLARAITLVESTRADHRAVAETLLEKVMPETGRSLRVGLSGVPGVGKSTFIEAFGRHVTEAAHNLAVLAVDPSSKRSGGSILGDKTRMEELARNPRAFIRPSPAGETLGGVARRTRETLLLCEAAGFDVILVETVGVGQSETAVADMTDLFVLMLLPGGGDELQGLKKGIVELADMILVNKADGELERAARRSAAEYHGALNLLSHGPGDGWRVPVKTCSAATGAGIPEAWSLMERFREQAVESGTFDRRRAEQARSWLREELAAGLIQALREDPELGRDLPDIERQVMARERPATVAARDLVDAFLRRRRGA